MNISELFERGGQTTLLAIGLMLVIVVMVLPVPSIVLDIGLTLSFALAILIFATAIFIEKPLDFSSFSSVLLASLILRLSLNVSSTKRIIGQGHTGTDAAGGVIQGFAMFIMAGNLFVGLVIFAVLIIVNFMVITKGAGRMAEVGARFALDAMPGKQLAIDSDLAVGAISHEEAKIRRQNEQEEAAFLGSLDGASKFVKGDAIAGLLITTLNLVAGIGFGVSVHQLSFNEALNNYSVLTVGDGLVSQIPAVIVSIAAAMLLSKGKDSGAIDQAIGKQLGGNSTVLWIVGGILAIFALMPGLPFVPFLLASAGFIGGGYLVRGTTAKDAVDAPDTEAANAPPPYEIGDAIYADEIHLEVAPDLVKLVLSGDDSFEKRVDRIRRYIAEEYGFVLPRIRMTDNPSLPANAYRIRIQGVELDGGHLRPASVLALMEDDQLPHLSGERVKEPVYKASARWVANTKKQELVSSGIPAIEPIEMLATHMLEVLQSNFSLIFTRQVLTQTLDALTSVSDAERAEANRRFLDEYIPGKVSNEQLLSVVRALLDERVPVRNLLLIIETMGELKSMALPVPKLVEALRQRLSFQVLAKLHDADGKLPLLQLSTEWEQRFREHEVTNDSGGSDIALPPEMFRELVGAIQGKLNELARGGVAAAVVTSSTRRKFLQTLLASKGIKNAVLSYEEISARAKPQILGVV